MNSRKQSTNKILIILLMPLAILLSKFLDSTNYSTSTIPGALILLLFTIICIIIIFKNRKDILIKDWLIYKKNKKYIILSIISAFISLLIIQIIRKGLVKIELLSSVDTEFAITSKDKFLYILGGIIPTLIPFIEEPVFRHEIYYSNRGNNIFLNILLAVVSSILFGLIHIGNYASIYQTIPLMFVGLYYCLIYRMTNNIFTPIISHVIYNGMLSLVPALILVIL